MPNYELLQKLMNAVADPKQLQLLVEQNRPLLDEEFARAAAGVWSESVSRGQNGTAQRAAFVAAQAFLLNGLKREAIRMHFEFVQFQFLSANTVQEYGDVREQMLQIVSQAQSVEELNTAFMGATRAVESSFFASKAELDFYKQQGLIEQGVRDAVRAAAVIPPNPQQEVPNLFGTYVDVMCTLYRRASERVWDDPQKLRSWWQQLAKVVEQRVPVDYELPPHMAGQASEVRRILAEFSELYGDPSMALKRLEFGLQK